MADCFAQAPFGAWSASETLGSRSRSKASPSPRARGEGWDEGRELRTHHENGRAGLNRQVRQEPRANNSWDVLLAKLFGAFT